MLSRIMMVFLGKLELDLLHLINRYEKSSRGVVFCLDKLRIAESYCFSFHVIQQYLVEKNQRSVIKVYDYYNPDATCTWFYSNGSISPMLRTICEGNVCECAEGGCPPQKPFAEISSMPAYDRRQALMETFCEDYDYVWRGRLARQMSQRGGFLNISFIVRHVIKEGIEKAVYIEGETRTLLARDNCQTANFLQGLTYLVLGKDGQAYKNENDETWYRYLLDQTSVVYQWDRIPQASNKKLQRDLNYVTQKLKDYGCEL